MSKIIEITPELNKRVQEERRREPRERMADMDRRLAQIAAIIEQSELFDDMGSGWLSKVYRLAKGEE